tara:strand:- start:533 stop:826 length:294 start_codon:yes stop_codon:yes gene_type:complete
MILITVTPRVKSHSKLSLRKTIRFFLFREEPMEVNEIRVEIRKHHVTPGVNVLDLVIDADGEQIRKQTQHKDTDHAFEKFVKDITKVAQELANARIE